MNSTYTWSSITRTITSGQGTNAINVDFSQVTGQVTVTVTETFYTCSNSKSLNNKACLIT